MDLLQHCFLQTFVHDFADGLGNFGDVDMDADVRKFFRNGLPCFLMFVFSVPLEHAMQVDHEPDIKETNLINIVVVVLSYFLLHHFHQ